MCNFRYISGDVKSLQVVVNSNADYTMEYITSASQLLQNFYVINMKYNEMGQCNKSLGQKVLLYIKVWFGLQWCFKYWDWHFAIFWNGYLIKIGVYCHMENVALPCNGRSGLVLNFFKLVHFKLCYSIFLLGLYQIAVLPPIE